MKKNKRLYKLWVSLGGLIILGVFLIIENIKLNISYGLRVLGPFIYADIVAIVGIIGWILVRKIKTLPDSFDLL